MWSYIRRGYRLGVRIGIGFRIGYRLTEYHTGYRAWSRKLLLELPLDRNSDDFVFDNQMLVQARYYGYRIGEISCPTRYFPDASSIGLRRSIVYGIGVLTTALQFRAHVWGLARSRLFPEQKEQVTAE